jgi:pyrimidine-nucleoside phosphorylase
MNILDILTLKREGGSLSRPQIEWLIQAYTSGAVPDYQMSAFLMAAFLRGMNEDETTALTDAMLYSGEVLDLHDIQSVKVDKHSTGGVGDKISLPLAPIVAACGVPVPMISGRGLGHSGGTLDKLESIPNFNVNLSVSQYRDQLAKLGVVMIGQTAEIAPADRKIYALRDATATVPFIPFIAGSIMSKKIASGIDALVLDVKCGRGAFMQTEADARKLAETLVGIGARFDKPTVAWLTNMDAPLGYAVGNWVEMAESIRCLKGESIPEVMELTYQLAGEMICLGGKAESPEAGILQAQEVVSNGKAFEKLLALVEAQGGDVSVVEKPETYPNLAPHFVVEAAESGYVQSIDALGIGKIAVEMGAGRMKKEDAVDAGAGMILPKKVGDFIEKGEVLAQIYTHKLENVDSFAVKIRESYQVGVEKLDASVLLKDRFTQKDGWKSGFKAKF